MKHELKIKPEYLAAIHSGEKTFEIRNNADRNFQVGDTLLLMEWVWEDEDDIGTFTGNFAEKVISYITDFEQKPGYVVLGLVNHREYELLEKFHRTGIAIEGIFGQVVSDQCTCGEPISVELNCPRRTSRTDKKRPFYPDQGLPEGLDPQRYSEHGSSVFRCRKCGEPVDETVPAAKYGVTA